MRAIRTPSLGLLAVSSLVPLVFAAACDQSNVTAPARLHAAGRANLDATAGTPVLDPASGHYYLAVPSGLSYSDAKAAAASATFGTCTAHLATINSAEEDAFVAAQLPVQTPWWIGGEQAPGSEEPAGGWGWVTGEPFTYTNWRAGEPNNSGNGLTEDNMYFSGGTGTFVDFNGGLGFQLSGYVVEFEACGHVNTPPVVSATQSFTTLPGQTVTLSVVASDADGDPLSYAWSFGDGTTATTTLPTVSHVYANPGSMAASVTVTDGQGGSATAPLTVTVQTPSQATTTVSQTIQTLVSTNVIPANEAGPLTSSLSNAAKAFASGNTTAGVNEMNAFIHKVQAQAGKKIPAAVADELVNDARQIIASA